MKSEEMRAKLIDATIQVVARDGLEKASTKLIGTMAQVNEAYIYRCFKDKEDMYAKAFSSLDNELVTVALENIPIMGAPDKTFKERSWEYYIALWKFLLGNKAKCLAFMRYYYSSYFAKFSAAEHERRYRPLVKEFRFVFKEESNVWMILNHMLSTMLMFAIKVFDGAVPDDEETAEHVFRLLYVSLEQYFKEGVSN